MTDPPEPQAAMSEPEKTPERVEPDAGEPGCEESGRTSPTSALMYAAALIIVLAGIKLSTTIVVPFLLATFVAILTSPFVSSLTRRKIPRPLSVAIVILVLLGVLTVFSVVVSSSVNALTQSLPRYQVAVNQQIVDGIARLEREGVQVSQEALVSALDPSAIFGVTSAVLSASAGIASTIILVLLVAAFMMLEAPGLHSKLERLLERLLDSVNDDPLAHATTQVQRYLVVKTNTSAATGLIAGVYVWFWGVDLALFWGLLAFALNYIPNIGSFLAAIPPVILALVLLGTGPALGVAIGYISINMIIGSIIEPRYMGQTLGLSPTVILLSLIFWGWMLGPVGALLSAPLTMIVKIMCDHIDQWNWLGDLLEQ